ncbi:hypothetical protein GGF32_008284 [Allomyces javanicus]|nr:hypothetical protein GGF32_008284 [Allomyces javanicus]
MKSTRRAISYAFLLLAALVAVQAVEVANLTPRPHLIRRVPRKLPLHVSGVSERRFLVEFDAPPAVRTAPAASGFAAMERSGASVDAAAAVVGSEDEAVAQHQEFKGFLAQSTLDVSVDRTFATLFNGAAVTVSSSADAEKLTAAPMVKAVYPVVHYRQAPIEVSAAQAKMAQPMMRYAQNMTGVVMARQNLGVTGKNVKIGIIDTGLDWTHPAFAVPGKKCDKWLGAGCRAVGGKDMVGDAYNSLKKGQDVPKPGDSPMDCAGHGTHVAGIAAGFVASEFSGVAPDAQLYPYRVFGCEGSTSNEIILAALEAAHKDSVDIVNMSLGGPAAFADAPDARAVDKLSKLGIMVISALGNDGDKGLFQASSPGIASKGFGVASFDNALLTINLATITGVSGLDKVGVNMDTELENEWPKGQTFTVKASPNTPTSANDGCEPFPAGYFAGKAALIRRGTCNFADKANNAHKAGATAVLVYNNRPGEIEGVSLAQPKFPLNIGFINADAGAAMWNAANGGAAVTFAFNGNFQSVVNPTSGMPSDFSSWGLGANLEQKPDISAPGGAIYSAWTSRRGKLWNTISGTSMATPFQAGVVALYLEKTKARRSPSLFDKILLGAQNTAHPAKYGDDSTMWPVAKQGAGLVDAYALLTNTVAATPSRIEFGDNPKGTRKTARIMLRNNGNAPVTYTITHRQARSVLGEYGAPQAEINFSSVGARVTIEPAQVTVDVNSQVMITVTATPQEMPEKGHWLLSGYFSFKPVADGKTPHVDEAAEDEESLMARRQKNPSAPAALSVPYSMMHGDYSTYPQLSTPSLGLPWLSTAPLGFWDFQTEAPEVPVWTKPGETTPAFTLKGLDMPVMLYQVTLVTRLAACAVLDAKTGAKIGYLNTIEQAALGSMFWPYTNQTDPETGKPVYGWNGEYYKTVEAASSIAGKAYQIPDGEYIWQLELTPPSVQHITSDFEKVLRPVWKSPKIHHVDVHHEHGREFHDQYDGRGHQQQHRDYDLWHD